jgi:preprotein translocase subunit SecD
MNKDKLIKLAIILIFIGIAILSYFISPLKFFSRKSSYQVTSFDDGKIEFTLQIKTSEAKNRETEYLAFEIEESFKEKGLSDFDVTQLNDKIEIIAREDKTSTNTINATLSILMDDWLLQENPVSLEGKIKYILEWKESARKEYERYLIDQIITVLSKRLDNFGFDDFSVDFREYKSFNKPTEIIVLIPLVKDINLIRNTLGAGGYLEFTEVIGDPASTEKELLSQYGGKLPEKTWMGKEKTNNEERYYLLKSIPIITGGDLKDSGLGRDSFGYAAVSFSLKAMAQSRFEKYTGENKGKRLAIVLDKKVISAPVIQTQLSDSGIIEGRFTLKEAETLALLLRTGALPAELEIVKERSIKP